MTMQTVLEKLQTLYNAATTTYLANARVYIWDFPTTRGAGNIVEIVLIPLPSEDEPVSLGDGWYDRFRVNIRASYPKQWEDANKHLAVSEELKQVIRDNWSWSASSEQAVLKSRRWGYGYEPKGEQRLGVIDMIVEYEAPGLSAT